MMLKELCNHHPAVLAMFTAKAADRKHRVWERNPLPVPLWSKAVFEQKLEYTHLNPVKAGLVSVPEEYRYFSAAFYVTDKSE